MTTSTVETSKIILKNGAIYDLENGRSGEVADVLIEHGSITQVAPSITTAGATEIECSGKFVAPGLVDVHTHIYDGVCKVGLDPVEAHYDRGVVAAADGGSVGASTFRGFRKFIVEPSPMRVVAFVNVSVLGLIDQRFGELARPEAVIKEDLQEVAASHPGIVRGLKIRLSHDIIDPDDMLKTLEYAVAIGQDLGLPLMAHIGHTVHEIADIVVRLAPGDIVTHCFTAKGNGILTDGRLDPSVIDARARGVLFDVGHGTTQMSYDVARRSMAQHFYPDLIGSDLSANNWQTPAFDLATVMSKMVALGMPLDAALAATTLRPAQVLGLRPDGYGVLTEGEPAYVTILDPQEPTINLPDAAGEELAVTRLEPTASILRDRIQHSAPWRGKELTVQA